MTEEVISYEVVYDRPYNFTWVPPPFKPPLENTTQAYGICFTTDGDIVLVTHGEDYWNLPGGGIEVGESWEETLVREVREEACAQVIKYEYIGCQRVDDPQNPEGRVMYYQTRFWAAVELDEFEPRYEILERKLVKPSDFLKSLTWGNTPIAKIILEEGLKKYTRAHGRGCVDRR